MAWKDKVFGNASQFAENTLYLATYTDDEETEDGRIKFSYAVRHTEGYTVNVNRSIKENKYHLKNWLKQHTAFDENDSDMTQLKAAKHLVLIGQYRGYSFIQKVYPLDEELLQNE